MNSLTPATSPSRTARWGALGLVVGTVLYAIPSAIHGDPPIEQARTALEYVAERGATWRIVHLANIAALLVWLLSTAAIGRHFLRERPTLRRNATLIMTVAAATFAVYFSIHAMGLGTAAQQYTSGAAPAADVFERTEAMLLILGSVAFTAQGLIGASIAMFGWVVAVSRLPTWLGIVGIAAGVGWLAGALVMNFAIIVPCTVLTWLWLIVVGAVAWRGASDVETAYAAT